MNLFMKMNSISLLITFDIHSGLAFSVNQCNAENLLQSLPSSLKQFSCSWPCSSSKSRHFYDLALPRINEKISLKKQAISFLNCVIVVKSIILQAIKLWGKALNAKNIRLNHIYVNQMYLIFKCIRFILINELDT